MKEALEKKWIEELKKDFPEFLFAIEKIGSYVEDFMELAQDYFICKQKISYLEKTGKQVLAEQYQSTLEELKTEIKDLMVMYDLKNNIH